VSLLETIAVLIGVGLMVYVTNRYGPMASVLMLVFGCGMTLYIWAEHIEEWWRNRD
jgi:hypothetical protein